MISLKFTSLALTLSVTLAACGGGGDTGSAAQDQPCAPTIQLFGDSTTDDELGSGPQWIERWGPRVSNRAVGGTNSTALRDGTDGLNIPWPGSVNAQYVVISHGLNDGYLPFPRAYTPLPQYIENLRFFADHASGAEVIFQTPLPSFRHDRDMTLYAQAMRDVAAEKGLRVIDVFACFQQQSDWQSMLPDEVHPNEPGKVRMVECAAPVVEALTCKA